MILLVVGGCDQGIDSISHLAPGNDESAPVIKVNAPTSGYEIKVPQMEASMAVNLEVTDDIELKSITLSLNGTDLKTFNLFKDYRRLLVDTIISGIVNGNHTLSIKATDIEGKVSTTNVVFSKVSPYTRLFDGEVFYMPFDGDLMEMISFGYATKVGSPSFADGGILDSKAYVGATGGYLTFPLAGLNNPEFSAAFWIKVNASPDRSGVLNVSPAGEDRTKGFRLFREGSDVKAGQTLYQIDPATYEANLASAKASWERAAVSFGKARFFLKQEWTFPSSTVSKKVKQRRQTE